MELEKSAERLARNPLGILALFIVMVYGFACLVLGFAGSGMDPLDRRIIVLFLITFPVLVLAVFTWLVSTRPAKLYSPTDYQTDEGFAAAIGIGTHIAAAEATHAGSEGPANVDVEHIARLVAQALPKQGVMRHVPRLLWVDDIPANNTNERRAFEDYGIQVETTLSTNEALERLAREQFDVIISDMDRPEGPRRVTRCSIRFAP